MEGTQAKLTAGKIFIASRVPDIAGIYEESAIEFPEKRRAPLKIQIELHISRLVDEVNLTILLHIIARTERTHIPTAHAVGPTGKITLLVGDYGRVSIGNSQTKGGVKREGVAAINAQAAHKIEVDFYILGIGNIKQPVLARFVLTCLDDL